MMPHRPPPVSEQAEAGDGGPAPTLSSGPLVWAAGPGWHPGVVGIVAARLKEAANRPAAELAIAGLVAPVA